MYNSYKVEKMNRLKENKYELNIFLPFLVVLCIFGSIILNITDLRSYEDYYYLYNRALQLLGCIKDGNSIMFFYNDINGVGYGSTFFYGYLTLLPFLPFVNMGYDIFFNSYFVVTGLIFCFGALYFTKKFTKNYVYIVTIYLLSTFVTEMFFTVSLITNYFAQGIGFLFLGFCVDFFRDRKHLLLVSFSFYLLLNTHLITSLVCFLCCIVIWFYYFDKKRIKEYLLLFVTTLVFCWFYFYNFFVHFDKNMYFNSITLDRLINNAEKKEPMFFGTPLIFFDYLFFELFNLDNLNGYSIIGPTVFFISLLVVYLNRKYFHKIDYVIIFMFFIGVIVGVYPIWKVIMNKTNIAVQFPMRFMFILLLLFLIVCFRNISNKHIFMLCIFLSLPNLLFGFKVQQRDFNTELKNIYNSQVINAEYAYEGFDLEYTNFDYYRTTVEDSNKNVYTFVEDNGSIFVKLDTPNETLERLRLPKLYYKGYKCEIETDTSELSLKVLRGKNGFIYVDIPENVTGVLKLYYDTLNLDILFCLNIVGIVFVLVLFFIKSTKITNKIEASC